MEAPLPYTAKLEIPTEIKNLSADYTDNCGHMQQVPVGPRLEEALIEGAYRTFKGVLYEGGGTKDAKPDAVQDPHGRAAWTSSIIPSSSRQTMCMIESPPTFNSMPWLACTT